MEYLVRSNIYDNYFASVRALDRGGYGYGGYYGYW